MPEINPTNLENIPTFAEDGDQPMIHAIVETPRDTRHKYAFDPKFGVFTLRTLLPEGLTWPYDYGFIPQTLAPDGDPLDALILSAIPTFTGCLAACRVLGLVRLTKDGTRNDRVLTAPARRSGVAQHADRFDDVHDVPKETLDDICRFLIEYSEEQGHEIQFGGVQPRTRALDAIRTAMNAYARKRGTA